MRKSIQPKNRNKTKSNTNNSETENKEEVEKVPPTIIDIQTENKEEEIEKVSPTILDNKTEDKEEVEKVQALSNSNEETLPQQQSYKSRIPSRSDSKYLQSLIYFDFGTGKKFISRTDPKKGFSESVFTLKSTLLNRPPNPEFQKQAHNPTEKSAENNESESKLLESGQTGEENEERVFECQATLYRLQMQGNDSNATTPPIKNNESPFAAANQSKSTQFQSILNSRPKSPFVTREKYELNARSCSSPNSKFVDVGTGSLHLNKCNGFYRLVMRRSQVGKVCLNMRVFKDMNPRLHSRNYVKFIGCGNPDANKNEKNNHSDLKFEIYLLKFNEETEQKEFFAKLNDAINDVGKK